MAKGVIRCGNCRSDISVLHGTVFHKTRKPLRVWFQAMWYVTNQKLGGSALGLQRVLCLGSYQTAWSWLHKMRHAMVRPDRDLLCGKIEIDETLIGGEQHGGKRGRGAENKHTDSWTGYTNLNKIGYIHKKINVSDSGDPAHVSLPGVHRISSLLKRWLLGTHQGSVSSKHLDYFLDEYTFRFNRRKSTSRGMLFFRLLQQAVQIRAITYRELADEVF